MTAGEDVVECVRERESEGWREEECVCVSVYVFFFVCVCVLDSYGDGSMGCCLQYV